jgi:hypothetical protein
VKTSDEHNPAEGPTIRKGLGEAEKNSPGGNEKPDGMTPLSIAIA